MRDITFVIINYNGRATVLDTIASILDLQGVDPRVLVVDDGSTDGSAAAIRDRFPDVCVYEEERNTREVNRLRNKGLHLAPTDRVFLTDNDVLFDPACTVEMLRVMDADDSVAACIPRLMYLNDESRIYSEGGQVHYLGATVAPTRDLAEENRGEKPRVAVGGGMALFDMNKLRRVGGFDEDYELAWGDDGELHQRLLLAGYKCIYVPTAVGYHEHKPFDESRHYRARGQVRNRWRFILTHYAGSTLAAVAPALLVFELFQAVYFLMKGLPLNYIRGTLDALGDLPAVLERRREVQSLRAVSDKARLVSGPLYVRPEGGLTSRLARTVAGAVSFCFSAYWRLVRPLLPGDASPDCLTWTPTGESNSSVLRLNAEDLIRARQVDDAE